MATMLDAHRLAVCVQRSAPCVASPLCPRPVLYRRALQYDCCQRASLLRAAAAAAEAVADAPSVPETDAQAAKRDDDFPDVHPDSFTAVPETDKYAVVEIGGVQMFVQEGRWYSCNRLVAEPGQSIKLGRVLALKEDGKFNIGTPYLESASVTAEVVDELKGPKLTIFKMRRKKHYRKKTGHRQPLTQFVVTEIKL